MSKIKLSKGYKIVKAPDDMYLCLGAEETIDQRLDRRRLEVVRPEALENA